MFGVSEVFDPKCDPGELRRASLSIKQKEDAVEGESAFSSEVHSQADGFRKRMLDTEYQGLDSP